MKSTAKERMVMGKRIRKLRKSMNLSMREFAKLIGRTHANLCRLEQGISYPLYATIRSIEELEQKRSTIAS